MEIFIERSDETKERSFSGTVSELLSELAINPEGVLVAKNGELVELDEELSDDDSVKILSVVSGG